MNYYRSAEIMSQKMIQVYFSQNRHNPNNKTTGNTFKIQQIKRWSERDFKDVSGRINKISSFLGGIQIYLNLLQVINVLFFPLQENILVRALKIWKWPL